MDLTKFESQPHALTLPEELPCSDRFELENPLKSAI